MTGFVYKWTNQINGKWYIGSHKGLIDDGYRHSSTSQTLVNDESKYGLNSFTRKILFEGDYEKDKIKSIIEAKFLQAENAANNPMSYNKTNITGSDCFSIEHRRKMSEAKLGVPKSKEHRKSMSEAHKGKSSGMKGKRHSEAGRKNISEALMGRKLSVEHKKNLSRSMKGKNTSPREVIVCPHCEKSGGEGIMRRWHFDNCRYICIN